MSKPSPSKNASPKRDSSKKSSKAPPSRATHRPTDGGNSDFVSWFRATAPYIRAHRDRTFVISMGGETLRSPHFRSLTHDLALLHSLDVRLVVVCGTRPQIESRLRKRNVASQFEHGLRITTSEALDCAKEASGSVRVELEAALSMGMPNSPMAGARIRTATGNFVTAKPVGVLDGIDFQSTGRVRRIDRLAIERLLDDGFVVLLTPLGYSLSGELFNLDATEVAASAAVALGADKLVSLIEGDGIKHDDGSLCSRLILDDARARLSKKRGLTKDERRYLSAALHAAEGGVPRTHLIPRKLDGSLVVELFTQRGIGTMLTDESFGDVRRAERSDVTSLATLLQPLEDAGVLRRRPIRMLEEHIDRFAVVERDGFILGCAALYHEEGSSWAELACLAVHPQHRNENRGDALLQYIEREASLRGASTLFALTTQTAHWFLERGFKKRPLKTLPKQERARYQSKRKSVLLTKSLGQ